MADLSNAQKTVLVAVASGNAGRLSRRRYARTFMALIDKAMIEPSRHGGFQLTDAGKTRYQQMDHG